MKGRIVVVNPNSTERVTRGIAAALAPLRVAGGPEIECVTLAAGPPGIESQHDAESVVTPLCDYLGARTADSDAFVIACYSDPGLHAAREVTGRPVLGIAECGMLAALTRGERFGVISILDKAVPRHLRYVRSLGLWQRFAGDLAIGLGIAELGDEQRVLEGMCAAGERLRDRHQADVLVMGCAGMARFHRRLEAALGMPVVEPTQAAVSMAMGLVLLGGAG